MTIVWRAQSLNDVRVKMSFDTLEKAEYWAQCYYNTYGHNSWIWAEEI